MLMRELVHKGFAWYFRTGGTTLRYPDGTERHYGPEPGGPVVHIRTWLALLRVVATPSLGFGQGYANGSIRLEPDSGQDEADQLTRFLDVVVSNARDSRLFRLLAQLRPRPLNLLAGQQSRNIRRHYDGDGPGMQWWYETVLGRTLLYTCARFLSETEGLDAAQDRKVHNIALKLGLKVPADADERAANRRLRFLSVGSGWGYDACYIARVFGVRVVGITISPAQLKRARRMAVQMRVADLVQFRLINYQELEDHTGPDQEFEGLFDGAYSIGMFEHVPHRDYRRYFEILRRVTKPGARIVVHCITNRLGGRPDPFVRLIFPGSRLGSLAQIIRAAKAAGCWEVDAENLWQHYVLTLERWITAHREHRDETVARLGEQFYRLRDFWLRGSLVYFRNPNGVLGLSQVIVINGKLPPGSHLLSRPV